MSIMMKLHNFEDWDNVLQKVGLLMGSKNKIPSWLRKWQIFIWGRFLGIFNIIKDLIEVKCDGESITLNSQDSIILL